MLQSTKSTDTLTKAPDYKKIIRNGSVDSMEKSTYNSSVEDDQSYNTYESQNPNPTFTYSSPVQYHKNPPKFENPYAKPGGNFDLAFKNEGFKDTSTFATNSQAGSVQDESINDETPIIQPYATNNVANYPPNDYYNTDTLPLRDNYEEASYDPTYNHIEELKNRLGKREKPPTPPRKYSPTYSDQLAQIGYNTIGLAHPHSSPQMQEDDYTQPKPRPRAKSEVMLETNFDYNPEDEDFLNPIGESGKWKSQPLETAM